MGLLEKSISISKDKTVFFSQFVKKYGFNICALLERKDLSFFITQSVGFDCTSLICSVSSSDFWNGTLKEKNKWYSFTKNESLLPFFQLFSFSLKEKISSLHISFINENTILMLCNITDSSIINSKLFLDDCRVLQKDDYSPKKIDLSFIKTEQINYKKISIDFSVLLNKLLKQNLKEQSLITNIKNIILLKIQSLLEQFFVQPNFVIVTSSGIFKVLFLITESLTFELIESHIKYLLSSFFNDEEKLIQIIDEGISLTKTQALSFLKG